MAARSSSFSENARISSEEKLVAFDLSNDGPSEVMRVSDQRRTREAEKSSLARQVSNSQKDKKDKAIIKEPSDHERRTKQTERSSYRREFRNSQKSEIKTIIKEAIVDFNEMVRGRVGTSQNIEAETQVVEMDKAGARVGTSQNLEAETQVVEMDKAGARVGTSQNLEAETQVVEMDKAGATATECACCYWDYQSENMVQCRDGHRFCFKCIRREVDEIIYGGLRTHAHGSFSCMDIYHCKESIPLAEIRKVIPNDVVEKYEYRVDQDTIVEAQIENLVYCPFCNIPYEIEKCVQVMNCPNAKCLNSSCIQCTKLSHLPLRCDEVEKKSAETAPRREVEERMTKAVIRKCNICNVGLIKEYGCNKVTCKCGNTMCYVCRKTLSEFDSSHFCMCLQMLNIIEGRFCRSCNSCNPMYDQEDDEALAAKEEALMELVNKNPELLDLEIGPPLTTQTQQPLRYGDELYMQPVPPTEIRHSPEFNTHGDQLPNMINLQFLRLGDQIARMPLNPMLPPEDFFRFGNGAQFPNIDVPAPSTPHPTSPPQEFFRYGNGGQPANIAVRAPHLVRYGSGGEPANMALPAPLPPQHFFRYGNGGHPANMALPAPLPPQYFFTYGNGGEPANMGLPARLPPQHFARYGNGGESGNMGAVPAQLPPQHFVRYGNGGEPANMALPAPSPPQHFFRYGNGGEPANMGLTARLPPRHFGRYGNGGEPANMVIVPAPLPPQHFFRYGNNGEPANMVVPRHFDRYGNGGRYANMNSPAQQDYGSR